MSRNKIFSYISILHHSLIIIFGIIRGIALIRHLNLSYYLYKMTRHICITLLISNDKRNHLE